MSRRFDYVKYDEAAAAAQGDLKASFEELEQKITRSLKPGRAQALVLTHLEEAYMWAGKALRDDCITRNPNVADEPHRTKE